MWPFAKKPSKDELAGILAVKVNGLRFRIRRLNPLMDFPVNAMPQVFSSFQSRRKPAEGDHQAQLAKAQQEMFAVVEAGLVEPGLVPVGKGEQRGKEDGITVEDIFRDADTGSKLYMEILAHSLNRYRGIRGSFFLARIRRSFSTSLRSATASDPVISPSEHGSLA